MDIYRQHIIDHFRNPKNEGKLDDAISHEENNPLCGDQMTIYLKVDNDTIEDIKFEGHGCAISKAAMSMLSEEVKGKTKGEICGMGLEDIKKLLGIPLSSSREKCAMLGLSGIKKAIEC